jgi:hypothetical protein
MSAQRTFRSSSLRLFVLPELGIFSAIAKAVLPFADIGFVEESD